LKGPGFPELPRAGTGTADPFGGVGAAGKEEYPRNEGRLSKGERAFKSKEESRGKGRPSIPSPFERSVGVGGWIRGVPGGLGIGACWDVIRVLVQSYFSGCVVLGRQTKQNSRQINKEEGATLASDKKRGRGQETRRERERVEDVWRTSPFMRFLFFFFFFFRASPLKGLVRRISLPPDLLPGSWSPRPS